MKNAVRALAALSLVQFAAAPLFAQDTSIAVQALAPAAQPAARLPAGTQVPLKLTQALTTKGDGWKEGDQFNLVTSTPVMLGDYTVIPEGTKAIGQITWLTSRGVFGKSGKMDIEIQYLELQGHRINLDGKFRQEGNGATLATVGAALLSLGAAAIVTGRSGSIPAGRELMATLQSDLPVALPAGVTIGTGAIQATTTAPITTAAPTPASTAPAVVLPATKPGG